MKRDYTDRKRGHLHFTPPLGKCPPGPDCRVTATLRLARAPERLSSLPKSDLSQDGGPGQKNLGDFTPETVHVAIQTFSAVQELHGAEPV